MGVLLSSSSAAQITPLLASRSSAAVVTRGVFGVPELH